ncbi:MAG: hypothetical protein JNM18_12910 [Planctomycetaceae bacterium]|nr:hypothetical protein [Planctomycetaceae bacterium]
MLMLAKKVSLQLFIAIVSIKPMIATGTTTIELRDAGTVSDVRSAESGSRAADSDRETSHERNETGRIVSLERRLSRN